MFGSVMITTKHSTSKGGQYGDFDLPYFGWVSDKKIMRMMEHVGRDQVQKIKDRTRTGVDANGKPFKPLAKSTRMASKPRPRRGSRRALPAATRGGSTPLFQTGNTFLNKVTYSTHAVHGGGLAHFYVRDVALKNGGSSAAIAAVHNSGRSFGPMTQANLKGGVYFRIPIRRGNKGKRDIGILKKFVRGRTLPKREFMGISQQELTNLAKSITTFLMTDSWHH